jgi:hypothetical protein
MFYKLHDLELENGVLRPVLITRELEQVVSYLKAVHNEPTPAEFIKVNSTVGFKVGTNCYALYVENANYVSIPITNLLWEAIKPAIYAQGFRPINDFKSESDTWLLKLNFDGTFERREYESFIHNNVGVHSSGATATIQATEQQDLPDN